MLSCTVLRMSYPDIGRKLNMPRVTSSRAVLPETREGPIRDSGRLTRNPEVISSPVGLVPRTP